MTLMHSSGGNTYHPPLPSLIAQHDLIYNPDTSNDTPLEPNMRFAFSPTLLQNSGTSSNLSAS